MTAHHPSDDDTKQLRKLSDKVTRIAAELARLSLGLKPAPPARLLPQAEVSAEMVDHVLHARRARAHYFPGELLADPAWDMLLDLFRCELQGRRLSTSDLCLGAGIPATTALRWISRMVEQGLLTREPDRHDKRRAFIALAPKASAALGRYFGDIAGEGPK